MTDTLIAQNKEIIDLLKRIADALEQKPEYDDGWSDMADKDIADSAILVEMHDGSCQEWRLEGGKLILPEEHE